MIIGRPMPTDGSLHPFVRVTLRRWTKIYDGAIEAIWPFIDLSVRIAIAQYILRSGLAKAFDWETTLLLATYEYPVSWMPPEIAAALGLAIELVGPILIALGLLTRPAALALGALTIVAQSVYVPTTTNLFLIAILLSYLVNGSAAFSLDRLLGSGFKASALPLAAKFIGIGEFLKRRIAPYVLLAIRLWLALTLLAAGTLFEPPIGLATWLPITSFAGISPWLAAILAAFLTLGFLTTAVSTVLIILLGAMAMVGAHPDVSLFPIVFLAVFDGRGPGIASLDGAIATWLEDNVLFDRDYKDIPESWPHIVVVGAGFGGLAAVNRLSRLPVRITLIDKRNYHLFQPLLYQIASATLSPADIAVPIRTLFKGDGNVRVIKSAVSAIDHEAKTIGFGEGQELSYDRLILATGASHSYFGNESWSAHAPGLKSVEDAVAVRGAILNAFEQAETLDDPERIRRLLNFVIVGAGPTGVELAGAIAELARTNVAREFRTIDPADARVILVQSGPRILPAFPAILSERAQHSLEELGVEVRTNSRVTEIAAEHVRVGNDEVIETETVLWAAGVVASPAAKWLKCEADRSGRVVVDAHLRPDSIGDVFVLGDTAASSAWDGNPVPGLAPAAKQAGVHVAKIIEAELLGKPLPAPFAYKHQGSLATIGRKSAVADFGRLRLSGAPAWWLWGAVHLGFLVGLRNRVSVVINWAWSFFAQYSGIRLITER